MNKAAIWPRTGDPANETSIARHGPLCERTRISSSEAATVTPSD